MSGKFERVARAVTRRPLAALLIVAALAIGGGVLALQLQPSTGIGTFVGSGSESYQATVDDQRHFGSDAVVVLIREPLTNLLETKDLGTLSFLEACLAGKVVVQNLQLGAYTEAPPGVSPYGGAASPCGKLMRYRPVKAVYGPATFLNHAVAAVNELIVSMTRGAQQAIQTARNDAYKLALGEHKSRQQAQQLAQAAGTLAQQQQLQQAEQLALQSGLSSPPRIDSQQFISQVVFDPTRGSNQPKARFSYLFPTADSALIQVRLKSSLTPAQQTQAISWIRQAVRMPTFRLGYGGSYLVSGAPVVLSDLSKSLTGAITLLLAVVLGVMAVVLLLVFRPWRRAGAVGRTEFEQSRWLRLLPLAIAVAAAGTTFGLVELAGASLTMASLAVLPILIGLAVDYAIQFQSRVQEARSADHSGAAAVARAARVGVPTIATAALATATGFLVLLLSPVPMMRSFGVLLVVGIAVALACALVACPAALALADRDGGALAASLRGAGDILGGTFGGVARAVGRVVTGAALVLRDGALALARAVMSIRLWRRPVSAGRRAPATPESLLARVTRRPVLVLCVALGFGLLGWIADTQTGVESNVTKLVPSSMPALRGLHTLERVTGVSGEIDVTVRAADVAKPQVVRWMTRYEQTLLTHFGYVENKGCMHATLCPALSLPDLFSSAGNAPGAQLSSASVSSLLAAVPPYFKQAVITPDRREAALAFGIRLMPLARQQQVIDYMRSRLHPPAGVSARLAGIPVVAAEANTLLSSSARRLLTLLAGMVAVALVLLAVLRRPARALVPLVPIALATGWSALIVFLLGIPLNPMSASLGTLVIAISTEFSVLLSERFRQERAVAPTLSEALTRTYRSTGVAVLASGITAIAGFGVLMVSDITMLREFGLVTVIDLTVSLCGVLVVLPAALAAAERGSFERAASEVRRFFGARTARLRRRPSVV
jgi:hydrophobe/amphiphile efflux-3 (HAE3) family protein